MMMMMMMMMMRPRAGVRELNSQEDEEDIAT